MALPFALAAKSSNLFESSEGFIRPIQHTVDTFKIFVLFALAVIPLGWIVMGYLTGKLLLERLEDWEIIKYDNNPEIQDAAAALENTRKK